MNQAAKGSLPRLLLLGARGFLGTFLARRASKSYEVFRADRSRESAETDVIADVADERSVAAAFDRVRPDAVVLLAAMSDIDRCQREPELAFSINVRGAEHVAHACVRSGARLLFTSTAAVFDGTQQGYREEDEVSPSSVYGETKAQAETAVQSITPSAAIVRVSLVLGQTGKKATNSLLDGMVRRWSAGEVISASAIEARNAIDAGTLSQWMLELLQDERSRGIFHAGATEAMTRFQLARAIAAKLGVPETLLKAELQPAAGRAPRGAHHFLLTDKINNTCATQAPSLETVIDRSLNEVA